MTWSRFDDAAAKCPKAVAAGNEAWSLWVAAVIYCNRHSTDGYISLAALATECLPVPISLAKAKTLAERLCSAKARPGGVGLFERAEDGFYLVHDFLDWNPSKDDVEAKRRSRAEAGRLGGLRSGEARANQTGSKPGSENEASASATPKQNGSDAKQNRTPPARPPAQPADPVPPAADPEPRRPVVETKVPCPPGLTLTEEQQKTLETCLVPGWAFKALTARFVAKNVGALDDLRTLTMWRKALAAAVFGDWGNARIRGSLERPPGLVAHEERKAATFDPEQKLRMRKTFRAMAADPDISSEQRESIKRKLAELEA